MVTSRCRPPGCLRIVVARLKSAEIFFLPRRIALRLAYIAGKPR